MEDTAASARFKVEENQVAMGQDVHYRIAEVYRIPVHAHALSDSEHKEQVLDNPAIVRRITAPRGEPSTRENVSAEIAPMSVWEESDCVCVFLAGLGVMALTPPLVLVLLVVRPLWCAYLVASLVVLAFLPASHWEAVLTSFVSDYIVRYFSFRGIWNEKHLPDPARAHILVAPPHGAFPFGNICCMLALPRFLRGWMLALAASAVFRVPIFRHFLTWIGCIDASRKSALGALARDCTIGISTGGIAEIFESNNDHETIILSNRRGVVRLAFASGADIVPCYLFGNSQALSQWYDEGGVMQRWSRALRVSLVVVWGRWLLPIPYRIPITGVMGAPIPMKKVEHPTDEMVEEVLCELIRRMKELFDTHKHAYGWGDKELIIK